MSNFQRHLVVLRQFAAFSAVGTLGFIVDAGLLLITTRLLDFGLYSGRLISFLAAASCTWALNRRFTFWTSSRVPRATQWFRFIIANTCGSAVNIGSYLWMITYVPETRLQPVAAVAVGSLAGLGFNFVASRKFVFRTV